MKATVVLIWLFQGQMNQLVLANCWTSLRENSCRLCLENASASILGCLPGNHCSAVVSVVSSLLVLGVGLATGLYTWKQRHIQKRRKGKKLFINPNTCEGVLPDGRERAVKRLLFNNRNRAAEFYNEVNIIRSVQHKNLVRLLGCSCSGRESLPVYEFQPNRSLDHFIFESLVYLQENCRMKIIHRDVKASNILLDSKLHAKIADFGLARSFQEDQTDISTAIAGALGYMAPEHLARGQLTEKADVYSLGVVLLEIVTGKQNNRSTALEYSDSLVTIVSFRNSIFSN
ncbi:hypothetical protein SLEP1_g32740 [Rubroshorea leprosula]|uniref:Protein kinase domain-containing protein n=1 Tax=Rubroshorea leprosula TaxID=152421 RepID=A0AAV5KEB5_9ROSI|nr:hypothetical protein SLEP1_g32740 [Rubroshorea leprosula]